MARHFSARRWAVDYPSAVARMNALARSRFKAGRAKAARKYQYASHDFDWRDGAAIRLVSSTPAAASLTCMISGRGCASSRGRHLDKYQHGKPPYNMICAFRS